MDDESAELADATANLVHLRSEMEKYLQEFNVSKLIQEGIRVTLCGPPNAGKSTLLNLLVGSEVAIVSAHPGTTRDVLKVDMDLNGYKVILQDTAGLRETNDEVEKEGIHRAYRAVKESVLRVVIVDVTSDVRGSIESVLGELRSELRSELKSELRSELKSELRSDELKSELRSGELRSDELKSELRNGEGMINNEAPNETTNHSQLKNNTLTNYFNKDTMIVLNKTDLCDQTTINQVSSQIRACYPQVKGIHSLCFIT